MTVPDLIEQLQVRLAAFEAGDASGVLDEQAIGESRQLWARTENEAGLPLEVVYLVASLYWYRSQALPLGQDQQDLRAALDLFSRIEPEAPQLIPLPVQAILDGEAACPPQLHPQAYLAAVQAEYAFKAGLPHSVDKAIELLEAAVSIPEIDWTSRTQCLSHLGHALATRFDTTEDPGDLDAVIRVEREGARSVGADHAAGLAFREGLTATLMRRFRAAGNRSDLDEAIATGREVIESAPPAHPTLSSHFVDLVFALERRFDHTGDSADIEEAVRLGRQGAATVPPGDPHRAALLSHLAMALFHRFERSSSADDIEAAVRAGRASVAIAPTEPNAIASNLALVLIHRFEWFGDPTDLEDAIRILDDYVDALPPDHPALVDYLPNLNLALLRRFELTGELADLDRSVQSGRLAVDGASPDRPRPEIWMNLSIALGIRFATTGVPADLDEAIDLERRSIESIAPDHAQYGRRLSNLALQLRRRYDHAGAIGDLDEAIDLGRRSVEAMESGEPGSAGTLSNLGTALLTRFESTGTAPDIDDAVRTIRRAIEAAAPEHNVRAKSLVNLAAAVRIRFEALGDPADLDEAARAAREAVGARNASAAVRIEAAKLGADACMRLARLETERDAESRGLQAALELYRTAVDLLPLLVWRGIGRDDQQRLLQETVPTLGMNAAACAIAAGDPELGVQLLEQGRGVLWGQLLDLRTDLDALRSAYPDFATELEHCREILDRPAEGGVATAGGRSPDRERRSEAGRRFDELLSQVRELPSTPDFPDPRRFLQPPRLEDLLPRGEGCIVVVNIAWWRCDALILTDQGVTVVELPFKGEEAYDISMRYLQALARYTGTNDDLSLEMATRPALEWLWDAVAAPVLEAIERLGPSSSELPRVWWNPTGPLTLLPVHAAGYHTESDGRAVIDRVVSSYTPTLRVLTHLEAPTPAAEAAVFESNALAVAIAKTPGDDGDLADLPGATSEQRMLEALLGSDSVSTLTDAEATREAIMEGLSTHQWVHIACHGLQVLSSPAQGGLVPHDWQTGGLIRVADLANLSSPGGKLAFLSACQTATGGIVNRDEAVNVAAAMQHAGWRHVIGTLWTVDDRAAAEVAASFYERILRNGRLDADGSARALHEAVRTLRSRATQHSARWAGFIHYGP